MATRRQKQHSMIVAMEKLIKRVHRDCNRNGMRHYKWTTVFGIDQHLTKPKR